MLFVIFNFVLLQEPYDSYKKCELLNDAHVGVLIDRKLSILNINTAKIESVCQGTLCKGHSDITGIHGGKGLYISFLRT